MTTQPTPHGNLLVVRGESIVHEVTGGIADIETGRRCGSRTRFQIASVSKQFTAAAVMLLVEQGSVALDDRVSRWIGGCPPSWQDINVHHLLTQTSGLGHWHDHPELELTGSYSPDEVLRVFQRHEPRFAPGTDWYYSSPGYVLLAHIVQRASGLPYREFLTGRILEPLGLRDTFVGTPDGQAELAAGHHGDERVTPFELDVLAMGTGDIWSTTGDLVRWDQALAAGRILADESRDLMFGEHARTGLEQPPWTYGYAWRIGHLAGQRVRCHAGDNPGFTSFNAWFPQISTYAVALTNNGQVDAFDLVNGFVTDEFGTTG